MRTRLFLLVPLALVLAAPRAEVYADGKKITIHNMSVKDERALWFAEYHSSRSGAERKGAPFKIAKRGKKTFTSAKLPVGKGRHLRWLKSNDFPKNYGKSAWDKVQSRKNMGTGKYTLYVSDHKNKGTYRGYYGSEWAFKSTKEFFEKYGKKAADAAKDVIDDIATAGDPCDVINKSGVTVYVGEYERKTAEIGKAQLLQGGSGKWKLEPGERVKFTKGKLSPGYTWRWVRWQKKSGLPKTVEAGTFRNHKGWKSNSKGINKIWLGKDRDGNIRGYTTAEWEVRKLALRTAVLEIIKSARKATGSAKVAIPPWLLTMTGVDRLLEAGGQAVDTVVRTALGEDPETFVKSKVEPIVDRIMTEDHWDELSASLIGVATHGTTMLDAMLATDESHDQNMALYRKLRRWNAIPDMEKRDPIPRTRGTQWNPKTFVGGITYGAAVSGTVQRGRGEVTVTLLFAYTIVFWRDPETRKLAFANSVSIAPSVSPAPGSGVSASGSVGVLGGPVFFFMDDPNNAGSHAAVLSGSYSANIDVGTMPKLQAVKASGGGIGVDLVVPIRGKKEDGGLAITGLGIVPSVTIGRSASKDWRYLGDQGPGVAFGYSWAYTFPR